MRQGVCSGVMLVCVCVMGDAEWAQDDDQEDGPWHILAEFVTGTLRQTRSIHWLAWAHLGDTIGERGRPSFAKLAEIRPSGPRMPQNALKYCPFGPMLIFVVSVFLPKPGLRALGA